MDSLNDLVISMLDPSNHLRPENVFASPLYRELAGRVNEDTDPYMIKFLEKRKLIDVESVR